VGIGQVDGIGFKQILDMIVLPKLLGIITLGVLRVIGIANIEFHLKHSLDGND
jgi:hypothetical protein